MDRKKILLIQQAKHWIENSELEMIWQRQRQRQRRIGFVPFIFSFTFTGQWTFNFCHWKQPLTIKSNINGKFIHQWLEVYRCVSMKINLFFADVPLSIRDDGPFLMQSMKWLRWKIQNIWRCHAFPFEMEFIINITIDKCSIFNSPIIYRMEFGNEMGKKKLLQIH